MRYLGSAHTDLPVGEVPCSNDELRQQLGLDNAPMPRTSLLGLMAAKEALTMSGLQPSESMAFISGTTVGGIDLSRVLLEGLGGCLGLDGRVCSLGLGQLQVLVLEHFVKKEAK